MVTDDSILTDAIDIHIHVGPDYIPRYGDAIVAAMEAAKSGMKAIVIKSHLFSTVAAAHDASVLVPEVKIFGGVALNSSVGGLSPRTVAANVQAGAKVIWLPTVDSKFGIEKAKQGHIIGKINAPSYFGYYVEPLSIIKRDGKLKSEVIDIIEICKKYNAVLCSGHTSPEECIVLAHECRSREFQNLEITHVNAWLDDFTISILKELTDCNATISFCCAAIPQDNRNDAGNEIVSAIRKIGAEHVVLMTDLGQAGAQPPARGFQNFCFLMKNCGITAVEMDLMIRKNPSRLLGLA